MQRNRNPSSSRAEGARACPGEIPIGASANKLRKEGGPKAFDDGRPQIERRKAPRVVFARPLLARILSVDGAWSQRCAVLDATEDGAQLEIETPIPCGSEFFLILSDGPKPVFRCCKCLWFQGRRMGIEMKRPDQEAERMMSGLDGWRFTFVPLVPEGASEL